MVVKCDECSFTARFPSEVKFHKFRTHSDVKPWPCKFPGCHYRGKTKSAVRIHQRTHETNPELKRPYECTRHNCNYRGMLERDVERHIRAHHTPGRTRKFKCPMCPSTFFTDTVLKTHIRRCHVREQVWHCSKCNFWTHCKENLVSHVKRIHENNSVRICSFPGCSHSTTSEYRLKKHEKIHDPRPAKIPCKFPDCHFSTTAEFYLKRHIAVRHNPDRNKTFICPLCSKALFYKHSLEAHINIFHTQEVAVHECSRCDYVGKNASNLKAHWRKRHEVRKDERWLHCTTCEYRARQKHQLELHVKTRHSEERDFKCHVLQCNFQTNHGHAFKNHLLIHEEDPQRQFPFACAFPGCDFRRRYKRQVTSHELLHRTSELQLRCKKCPDKYYPDKSSLFFHDCIAHDRKSYKCPMCNYAACKPCSLSNHVRTVHANSKDSQPYEASTGKESQAPREVERSGAVLASNIRVPLVLLERVEVKVL